MKRPKSNNVKNNGNSKVDAEISAKSQLLWSPFTYLIIESKTRKIVYKITMAEKVNNELIFAHLLRPLDMYELMAVMQNDSQPGDIFLDTRTRGVYKIHKNNIELIGVY